MRKKSASGVLASLKGSTYGTEYGFAPSLAAALLDDLFAHPAGYSDADTARELIAAYCEVIEFFRSLLGPQLLLTVVRLPLIQRSSFSVQNSITLPPYVTSFSPGKNAG
jgi:hypothetical protein